MEKIKTNLMVSGVTIIGVGFILKDLISCRLNKESKKIVLKEVDDIEYKKWLEEYNSKK